MQLTYNNLVRGSKHQPLLPNQILRNPFSRTGTNYRDLLNYHGILNSNNVIQSEWSEKLIPLHNDVKTLQELIEIRDGYKECFGFTQEDINNFITNLCTK